MRWILMSIILIGFLLSGCIGGKKQCDSAACIKTALSNNCEEAYYEGEALGMKAKSEIFREGDKCKVVEGVYTASGNKISEAVCTYDMPVSAGSIGDCKRI